MDIVGDEILRFWRTLNQHQVKYIMIGGFAIRFHGFNRHTEDVDLWLEDTLINRKNLRQSFIELGYGDFPMIETMKFTADWTTFSLNAGIELDILTNMKGLGDVTFDTCLNMASIAELDGIEVPFLHINQLIENKKATNRPKDQIDVLELEKIKQIREADNN